MESTLLCGKKQKCEDEEGKDRDERETMRGREREREKERMAGRGCETVQHQTATGT